MNELRSKAACPLFRVRAQSSETVRRRIRILLAGLPPLSRQGRLRSIEGTALIAELPGARVGSLVGIESEGDAGQGRPSRRRRGNVLGEVIAVRDSSAAIALLSTGRARPLGAHAASSYSVSSYSGGLRSGATVTELRSAIEIGISDHLLGTVIDPFGVPLDRVRRAAPAEISRCGLRGTFLAPFDRAPISTPLRTGLRAIDCFAPIGLGQRLAVLAEAGVGKSSLLAAIARHSGSDVTILALIGERGREVRELLEEQLPAAVRARTTAVVSTSEEPALRRIYCALTATRIAEYFRDRGMRVLLLLDSLTRLTRAYREIGLLSGEAPVRRGYPVSVYARLPELIERAGAAAHGSITALYTVLLTGELGEDPMVEEIKSLTDGHLTLRRELATRGIFPALDIVHSLSRLERTLHDEHTLALVRKAREILGRYAQDRELLALGAADPELRSAARIESKLAHFISQRPGEVSSWEESLLWLERILTAAE